MHTGAKHSPNSAAAAPSTPRMLVPTNTARFTWLAPGRMRHIVSALRNSDSPSHFFCTTSTSRDQADRPPPNDASAMWLNVHASSGSDTRGMAGDGSGGSPGSLMNQFGIVREVVLDVLGGAQRVRGLVVVR